jgi:hypothetical protein
MGVARSVVAEVGATTSTDVSIEDPALPDCGCSEINRRNSSMLQSMETKFAILFFQLCSLFPAPTSIARQDEMPHQSPP